MATADLCDKHIGSIADAHKAKQDGVQVLPPKIFSCYGANRSFFGQVFTVKCFQCNTLVRKALEGPGEGRVLIVDGGDSDRCALVGDALADLAVKNNWKGIVVNGLIRDSEAISKMAVGVKALGTHPLKSDKAAADQGQQQVDVVISGCKISPGDWIYADWDGVVVSKKQLQ
eukprot:GHRR01024684.1.p1 GENE.GHRR01024684.1~~GHRR01024684.1.p1  ORF type:complete len:201 (+),score=20.91 GHRR01024684.1:90-605(+)